MTIKGKEINMSDIPKLSEKELKQVAMDIVDKKIFHSEMLKDETYLHAVFMPLLFVKEEQINFDLVGLLYEYMDKATPRTINGLPTFSSANMLHREQVDKLQDYINKFIEMRESFVSEEEEKVDKKKKKK
jgi:hypothetical protein